MNFLLADLTTQGGGFWMPVQASDFAVKVDALYDFILWLSVFFFFLLIGLTVYFMWKYRQRSPNQRTSALAHSFKLEFAWSAIPTVLLIVIFAWGFQDFQALSTTPADALRLNVEAGKWNWSISYPELDRECSPDTPAGKFTQETHFYLPVNRPFTVRMKSRDVLHSFWIPAFRVKRDVLPNRYTGYTVTPIKTGTFPVFCAEYCGQAHSRMTGWVTVLSEEEWDTEFVNNKAVCNLDPKAPDYKPKLFGKHCGSCHTVEEGGGIKVGPNLFGLHNKQEKLADGTTITADDNYLRESILYPEKKIVAGFEGQNMTAFRGRLSDDEITALIDYIQSLK
jgi:cytochrome c oxidase subunit 2